ncbi:hypothetical protein BDV32DRAFT_139916 [Aspergillus pseudonomiae]|nr:hypothetical protein BDV32DRAFT_139916 [Aspergillus pseudonomiae]
MEVLRIEIKWHICHFVKADPLGTLADLNLTSRSWHDATAPILYETLRIRFRGSASLQQVALELKEGGRGRLFLRHARRLDIVCFWDYTDKPWLVPNSKYQSMESVHYGPPASGNTFLEYRLKECLDPRLWSRFPGPSYYVEEEWQPLVSLIAHLERLSELNYVVKNMYPLSLHQVLRQLKPDSSTLLQTQCPCAFKNLDDLRSSGLHTVASWVHSDTTLLILCMVRTLKHLHIRGRGFSSVALLRLAGKYNTTAVKPIPVACLDSLSFTSPARYGAWEKTLLKLASAVDLSRLRSLDIAVHSDSTLLR